MHGIAALPDYNGDVVISLITTYLILILDGKTIYIYQGVYRTIDGFDQQLYCFTQLGHYASLNDNIYTAADPPPVDVDHAAHADHCIVHPHCSLSDSEHIK